MSGKGKYRIFFYLLGLLILAFGISLNTKAGLGVTAIISVSYSVSIVTGFNFGNTTLALYVLFVVLEMILHMIREKRYERDGSEVLCNARKRNRKMVLLMDFLQIPLSIVFTRFLNVFSAVLPDISESGEPGIVRVCLQFGALFLAIVCTGVGAAMSLNMRLIPNPGDGIVQAVADFAGKEVGFTKNCVDIVNIIISTMVGLLGAGRLAGVGIGTVFAVVGVGRVIALFNHLFFRKMTEIAGVEE